MGEILVLLICVILIVVCFAVAKSGKQLGIHTYKQPIPDVIQSAFRDYADSLLLEEGILIQEAKVTNWETLEEIPFDKGMFTYSKIEYNIEPENPVQNAQGIVLNSREIFAKAGIKDTIIVLFYKEEEDIFEISFMPEHRISMQGYKAYIDSRYRNLKEMFPLEEYSLVLEDKEITLWDDLAEKKSMLESIEGMTLTRTKAEGEFAYSAQYIDVYENNDIQICSWVQFEKKRELIYSIKAKTYKSKTLRDISVGSTVQELKDKYSLNLSFLEDFNGEGPIYGFIPEDETNCYIGFKAEEGIISEIIITDSFGERPFMPKDGYIDQDIPWIEVSYEEKLTEKYARALYLGQHKVDLDPTQVFNTFVANNCKLGSIIQKGLWKENVFEQEKIYFAICDNDENNNKLYAEVKLKQVIINTFTKDTPIWVITHKRSQQKRG